MSGKNSKKKVFLVEDEAIIAMTLQETLEDLGYEVCGIESKGEVAIEKLEELKPDLLLMDVMLSGQWDGIQTASEVKKRFDLPIVFLTAYSNQEVFEKAKLTDAYSYILKPFNERELSINLEMALYKYNTHKELQEKEKLYKGLAESIPQIVFECGATGDIVFLNQPGKDILGYTDEDIEKGLNLRDWVPENHTDKYEDWLQSKATGQSSANKEYSIKSKYGRIIYVEEHVQPIKTVDKIQGYRGVLVNITERKKQDQFRNVLYKITQKGNQKGITVNSYLNYLRKELLSFFSFDELYFNLFDKGSDYITTLKPVDNGRVLVNEREFGNALTEYVIRNTKPLVLHENDSFDFHKENNLAIIGKKAKSWIGVPVYNNDEIIGVFALQSYKDTVHYTDLDTINLTTIGSQVAVILEKLEQQKKIAESEKRFRTIFHKAPVGILTVDEEGIILAVNTWLCDRLGYQENELLGRSIKVMYPDSLDTEKHKALLKSYFAKPSTRMMAEMKRVIPVKAKDESLVPMDITLTHFKDRMANVDYSIAILNDLSTQFKADQALANLAEKETLLKEIHHRVKNNMQIISSLLSLQEAKIEDPEMIMIHKESQGRIRAMALVHEKLYNTENLSEINFKDYTIDLVNYVVNMYGHAMDVACDYDISDVFVNLDTAIPLGIILNEIVTNSLKYAFDYSTGEQNKITVVLKKEDGVVNLLYKDSGKGVDDVEAVLKGGKSLGMKLVESLVKQVRGELKIFNDNGFNVNIKFKPNHKK